MTFLLVFIPLMIFAWPRFDRTLWIQIAFCVVIGWWLMMVTLEAEIGETLREFADKSSAGLELSSEEKQFDGTGDRAVSLQVGWFPPLVIAAIACGVRWGSRRLFNRPRNPYQQATHAQDP